MSLRCEMEEPEFNYENFFTNKTGDEFEKPIKHLAIQKINMNMLKINENYSLENTEMVNTIYI